MRCQRLWSLDRPTGLPYVVVLLTPANCGWQAHMHVLHAGLSALHLVIIMMTAAAVHAAPGGV